MKTLKLGEKIKIGERVYKLSKKKPHRYFFLKSVNPIQGRRPKTRRKDSV